MSASSPAFRAPCPVTSGSAGVSPACLLSSPQRPARCRRSQVTGCQARAKSGGVSPPFRMEERDGERRCLAPPQPGNNCPRPPPDGKFCRVENTKAATRCREAHLQNKKAPSRGRNFPVQKANAPPGRRDARFQNTNVPSRQQDAGFETWKTPSRHPDAPCENVGRASSPTFRGASLPRLAGGMMPPTTTWLHHSARGWPRRRLPWVNRPRLQQL